MNQVDVRSETNHQWPQVLAVIVCCIIVIGNGLHFSWPSPAIPKLLAGEFTFNVSRTEISYIVMVSPLTYTIGGPLSTLLLDKIGRKFTITSLALPQIVAWLLIARATNVYMLYVSRIASGIAEAGGFTAIPVYIGEIAEPKIRGAMGIYFTVSLTMGFLLYNIYGSCMPLTISAYVSISIPLLSLMSFIWMPESPYFLLMKDQPEKARKSLKTLRRIDNVDEELHKLTTNVTRQLSEPKRLRDVFAIKSNLKSLSIIIALRTIQQFNGGASIVFYNQLIFLEARGVFSHIRSALVYYTITLAMSLVSSFTIDRFGRRPLLLISLLASSICLLTEGFYFYFKHHDYDVSGFKWVPITGIVFYAIFRAVGVQGVPTMITGELFSASVKAKAVGISIIYLGVIISVCSKLFEFLMHRFGMHVPFFLFTVCSWVGAVFVWYCVPETKGITLDEIQRRLSPSQ